MRADGRGLRAEQADARFGSGTDSAHSPHSTALKIALLLFVGFSALYVALARGVFVYGDDVLMFQVTQGLVERGEPAVTSPSDHGDVAISIPGRGGRNYAKYGLGQSLVAVPAYTASELLLDPVVDLAAQHDRQGNLRSGTLVYCTSLTNAALGGAVVALLFLLARAVGYAPLTGLVLAGLLGLGTLLAHYAATFLSEPLSALCLLATVYGLVRADAARAVGRVRPGVAGQHERADERPWSLTGVAGQEMLDLSHRSSGWAATRGRPYGESGAGACGWLALSGVCAGLALATRAAHGVVLVAPGLWVVWLAWKTWGRSRRAAMGSVAAWGVPVAGWLAVIGAYNWLRFGDVLETGYGAEARAYSTPFWTGLYGLLLSPGKGLVWYDPPLSLGLLGTYWFLRRRPALGLTLVGMTVALVALYARYYQWWGGGVWGTRLLVPVVPLLLLPAGEVVERVVGGLRVEGRGPRAGGWGPRVGLAALVVVAGLGLFVTALGVLVPFDGYVLEYTASVAAQEDALWKVRDSPLVVHAARLDDALPKPDIAAVRYASEPLALVSLAGGLVWGAALGWAILLGTGGMRTETAPTDRRETLPSAGVGWERVS